MKELQRKHNVALICIMLVGVTLAVYWQVTRHEYINFDDNLYISHNQTVQTGLNSDSIKWAFSTFYAANWHPVTWLSHMLDMELFGLDPGKHHLTNLILHVLNTLLLFVALSMMTGMVWRSGFVAALFALHPLHIESVAWIAERKDLLSTFFFLLTVISYAKYVESKKIVHYLFVVVWFVLALCAKPMVVTLPCVLLLLDIWPLQRVSIAGVNPQGDMTLSNAFREKIPLFILSIVSSLLTIIAQTSSGSIGDMIHFSILDRLSNAFLSYAIYIRKMFWPNDLAIFYPFPETISPLHATGAFVMLALISVAAIRLLKTAPWFGVGWAFFLGTLFPVIGLVQIGNQAMADRYTYIPLIGLFIIITWTAAELGKIFRHRKIVLSASGVLVIAALSFATIANLRYWKDSSTIFTRGLEVTQQNWVAHTNLGILLLESGQEKLAIDHLATAIKQNPGFAKAHFNLAAALDAEGNLEDSIRHFTIAAELKPDYLKAHIDLGKILMKVGNVRGAMDHYFKALKIDPDSPEAHFNLATAYANQGQIEYAIHHYEAALKQKPDFVEAYTNLGSTYLKAGKPLEGLDSYYHALRLDPENPRIHYQLAAVLLQSGSLEKGILHLKETIKWSPENTEAMNNLGVALLQSGKISEAEAVFRKLLAITPDDQDAREQLEQIANARSNMQKQIGSIRDWVDAHPQDARAQLQLGRLYYLSTDYNRSLASYEVVLRIDPDNVDALNGLAAVNATLRRYDQSLSMLIQINRMIPDNAETQYNIACMYARQNRTDEALHWLESAIEQGYKNWIQVKSDPDLDPIRDSEEFKAMLNRYLTPQIFGIGY